MVSTSVTEVHTGRSRVFSRVVEPVRDLVERIVSTLQPEEIWLFGSRARGEGDPSSDWDFLVILSDDAPEPLLEGGRVWELCLRGATVPADIVPVRRSDFERFRTVAGSLCRTVAEEGRSVYAR
jgi:predicted nucleotidyltransferase